MNHTDDPAGSTLPPDVLRELGGGGDWISSWWTVVVLGLLVLAVVVVAVRRRVAHRWTWPLWIGAVVGVGVGLAIAANIMR